VNTLSNVVRYKIYKQKAVAFLYNNKQAEKEIRKPIPFTMASKNT
jgi:hypothetical protein